MISGGGIELERPQLDDCGATAATRRERNESDTRQDPDAVKSLARGRSRDNRMRVRPALHCAFFFCRPPSPAVDPAVQCRLSMSFHPAASCPSGKATSFPFIRHSAACFMKSLSLQLCNHNFGM
uniref:Uncharacterized protein n=1 Tax=Plectus sambesii TaxID=2011161 RepID=A0A914WW53_9BILA